MFGFKRRAYRQRVETNLSYLVGFNRSYFEAMYASFDGVRGVIDDGFAKARETMDFAVELWGIMFSYEIERSPLLEGEGERIIAALAEGGERRFNIETSIAIFISTADVQVALGAVKTETLERSVDEIIGALRGIPRQERAARRLGKFLEDSFDKASRNDP